MAQSIMPLFDTCQEEGKIVGRLLAGYGDLEFRVYTCLAGIMDDAHVALKVFYRVRGEEQRIQIADAIMRDEYTRIGLSGTYAEAISDMIWCRKVRNQYAHCQWFLSGPPNLGLSFINHEEIAKRNTKGWEITQCFTPQTILRAQEAYFIYVRGCLLHLESEYQLREGKIPSHASPLPKKIERPRRYSDNPLL